MLVYPASTLKCPEAGYRALYVGRQLRCPVDVSEPIQRHLNQVERVPTRKRVLERVINSVETFIHSVATSRELIDSVELLARACYCVLQAVDNGSPALDLLCHD